MPHPLDDTHELSVAWHKRFTLEIRRGSTSQEFIDKINSCNISDFVYLGWEWGTPNHKDSEYSIACITHVPPNRNRGTWNASLWHKTKQVNLELNDNFSFTYWNILGLYSPLDILEWERIRKLFPDSCRTDPPHHTPPLSQLLISGSLQLEGEYDKDDKMNRKRILKNNLVRRRKFEFDSLMKNVYIINAGLSYKARKKLALNDMRSMNFLCNCCYHWGACKY